MAPKSAALRWGFGFQLAPVELDGESILAGLPD
jgi:hypothetical protein